MALFTIRMTDAERRLLKKRATEAGFDNASAYVRYVSLVSPRREIIKELRALGIRIQSAGADTTGECMAAIREALRDASEATS